MNTQMPNYIRVSVQLSRCGVFCSFRNLFLFSGGLLA